MFSEVSLVGSFFIFPQGSIGFSVCYIVLKGFILLLEPSQLMTNFTSYRFNRTQVEVCRQVKIF